ncbi:hypothetical protein PSENEW3_00003184 [Picochlorum sp. SENEW3]|nr:hypothetical protein PSENEW3_00003184 [Picochlorum sp. SENEW3]
MDAGQDHNNNNKRENYSSLDRENSQESLRPAEEKFTAGREKQKQTLEGNATIRRTDSSMDVRRMSAQEAVERILQAYKDKDYFRMLGLEYPDVDALGRPVWHVTPSEVSRAYRRLSILVHPDRNPGEDAREAFEALNESHKKLKDPEQIDTILKDNVGRALQKRDNALASGTLQERVERMSKQQEEEQKLRQEEYVSLNDEILEQMRERQARHALKKRRAEERQQHRYRESHHHHHHHDEDTKNMTEESVEQMNTNNNVSEEKVVEEEEEEARRRRRKTMARRQKKKEQEQKQEMTRDDLHKG